MENQDFKRETNSFLISILAVFNYWQEDKDKSLLSEDYLTIIRQVKLVLKG
jgi:hypothetical protein